MQSYEQTAIEALDALEYALDNGFGVRTCDEAEDRASDAVADHEDLGGGDDALRERLDALRERGQDADCLPTMFDWEDWQEGHHATKTAMYAAIARRRYAR